MIVGITLSEYIRKRRLLNDGFDLYKQKVFDIVVKYQYDNDTLFSVAFEKFHGIKLGLVNKQVKLKNYFKIRFNQDIYTTTEYGMVTYDITRAESPKCYCLYIKVIEKLEHIKISSCRKLKFNFEVTNYAINIRNLSY